MYFSSMSYYPGYSQDPRVPTAEDQSDEETND